MCHAVLFTLKPTWGGSWGELLWQRHGITMGISPISWDITPTSMPTQAFISGTAPQVWQLLQVLHRKPIL